MVNPRNATEQEVSELKREILRESYLLEDDVDEGEVREFNEMFSHVFIAIFDNPEVAETGWSKWAIVLFPTRVSDYRGYVYADNKWSYAGQSTEVGETVA